MKKKLASLLLAMTMATQLISPAMAATGPEIVPDSAPAAVQMEPEPSAKPAASPSPAPVSPQPELTDEPLQQSAVVTPTAEKKDEQAVQNTPAPQGTPVPQSTPGPQGIPVPRTAVQMSVLAQITDVSTSGLDLSEPPAETTVYKAGQGTITFEPTTQTLTLDNAEITTVIPAPINMTSGNFKIVLKGTSVLTGGQYNVWQCENANLTFEGEGKLILAPPAGRERTGIYTNSGVTINSGEIDVSAPGLTTGIGCGLAAFHGGKFTGHGITANQVNVSGTAEVNVINKPGQMAVFVNGYSVEPETGIDPALIQNTVNVTGGTLNVTGNIQTKKRNAVIVSGGAIVLNGQMVCEIGSELEEESAVLTGGSFYSKDAAHKSVTVQGNLKGTDIDLTDVETVRIVIDQSGKSPVQMDDTFTAKLKGKTLLYDGEYNAGNITVPEGVTVKIKDTEGGVVVYGGDASAGLDLSAGYPAERTRYLAGAGCGDYIEYDPAAQTLVLCRAQINSNDFGIKLPDGNSVILLKAENAITSKNSGIFVPEKAGNSLTVTAEYGFLNMDCGNGNAISCPGGTITLGGKTSLTVTGNLDKTNIQLEEGAEYKHFTRDGESVSYGGAGSILEDDLQGKKSVTIQEGTVIGIEAAAVRKFHTIPQIINKGVICYPTGTPVADAKGYGGDVRIGDAVIGEDISTTGLQEEPAVTTVYPTKDGGFVKYDKNQNILILDNAKIDTANAAVFGFAKDQIEITVVGINECNAAETLWNFSNAFVWGNQNARLTSNSSLSVPKSLELAAGTQVSVKSVEMGDNAWASLNNIHLSVKEKITGGISEIKVLGAAELKAADAANVNLTFHNNDGNPYYQKSNVTIAETLGSVTVESADCDILITAGKVTKNDAATRQEAWAGANVKQTQDNSLYIGGNTTLSTQLLQDVKTVEIRQQKNESNPRPSVVATVENGAAANALTRISIPNDPSLGAAGQLKNAGDFNISHTNGLTVAGSMENTGTVQFPEGTAFDKVSTVPGAVKIGDFLYGGDITQGGLNLSEKLTQPTVFKAGEGVITVTPSSSQGGRDRIEFQNAAVYNSVGVTGCGPVEIVLTGANAITGTAQQTMLEMGDAVISGTGTLNVTNQTEAQNSIAVQADSLSINGGTLLVSGRLVGNSIAINGGTLQTSDAGSVQAEMTKTEGVYLHDTVTEVFGATVLDNDLTTESGKQLIVGSADSRTVLTVPAGRTLTVNKGGEMQVYPDTRIELNGSGAMINHGTIHRYANAILPESVGGAGTVVNHYAVEVGEGITGLTGVELLGNRYYGKAGDTFTFKADQKAVSGKVLQKVSYQVENSAEVLLFPDSEGIYSVPGNAVTGSVKITAVYTALDVTAPKASLLTYNGSSQVLVQQGSAPEGFRFMYTLDAPGSADRAWSEELPAAQNAGEYKVYYRVENRYGISKEADTPVTVQINAKEIAKPEQKPDFTYNGTVQSYGTNSAELAYTFGGDYQKRDVTCDESGAVTGYAVTISLKDKENTVWEGGGTEDLTHSFVIRKADPTKAMFTVSENVHNYDDAEHTAVVAANTDIVGMGTITVNTKATDAGSTAIEISVAAGANYNAAALTLDEQLTIRPVDPTAAMFEVADNVYTYDGDAHQPTVTVKDTIRGMGEVTVNTRATDAGSKTIEISLAKGDNYNAKTISLGETLTIQAKPITGAEVALSGSLKYNGKTQTQNVQSVTVDGLAATYDVTNNTGKDAGNYTMTITGKGNFTGEVTKDFAIAQHDALALTAKIVVLCNVPGYEKSLTLADVPGYPADSGTTPTIVMETPVLGANTTASLKKGVLTLAADNTNLKNDDTIVVNLTGMKNYADSKISVTIRYGDRTSVDISGITVTGAGKIYDGNAVSYTGTITAKEAASQTVVTPSGYSVTWQKADGTLLEAAPANAGAYKLVVEVNQTDPNHVGKLEIPFAIEKKALTWDSSNLYAAKPQNDAGAPAIYGELAVQGTLANDTTYTAPDDLTIETMNGEKAPGMYADQQLSGSFGTLGDDTNYILPTALPKIAVEITKVSVLPEPEIPTDTPDTKFKLESEEGISQVSAELRRNPELNTPQKIESRMQAVITELDAELTAENIRVFDVKLMVSTNNGTNWRPATKDDFPADGKLIVTIPYPAGTSMNSHDFVVVHMFTTSDFDKTPGQTEVPAVTKTPEGIRFAITGLSPVSVAWKKVPPVPESNANSAPAENSESVPTVKPESFDWQPIRAAIAAAKPGARYEADVARENAVPHYIWQAFYGKDVTVTLVRGMDRYVFNGLDLERSGFDPDNGHNLSDLTAYIGRTYGSSVPAEKPDAQETKEPEEPKDKAETEKPKEAEETVKPEATPVPTEEPASQPLQNVADTSHPVLWTVLGLAAAALVIGIVVIVKKKKQQ